MKLSEAIRLGAMLRPQGFPVLDADRTGFGTCALLAASDAVGEPLTSEMLERRWPELYHIGSVCPECGVWHVYVTGVIGHLNDYHRWTREQIADWVETVEPSQVSSEAAASAESAVAVPAVQAEIGTT